MGLSSLCLLAVEPGAGGAVGAADNTAGGGVGVAVTDAFPCSLAPFDGVDPFAGKGIEVASGNGCCGGSSVESIVFEA